MSVEFCQTSAFSKTSLNIWKFTVHILLKPGLENFKHCFTSVWDEHNCAVVWAFFGIGMKTDIFQSCGHCWVFQICWHIEGSTFIASSFRIWNREGLSREESEWAEKVRVSKLSECWESWTPHRNIPREGIPDSFQK